MPTSAARTDALKALDKRANIHGAALFHVLARRRDRTALRLLVTFEIIADFLDCVSERGARIGVRNGDQMHRALLDALGDGPLAAYYELHDWQDDAGYARSLVESCRALSQRLPGYLSVRPLALQAAGLAASVLPINHEPDVKRRNAGLARWTASHTLASEDLAWWESSGAASAWLTVLALLALAAEREGVATSTARAVYAAYLPWVSLVGTMLDSYGDIGSDAAHAQHSYVSHYGDTAHTAQRIAELLRRARAEVQQLPGGEKHLVVLACMAAMYLTQDEARRPPLLDHTPAIARAGGLLTTALIPVLRLWRLLYGSAEREARRDAPHHATATRHRSLQLPPGSRSPALLQTFLFWRDPHCFLQACRNRYGPTFTIRPVKLPPFIFTADPESIRSIINAPADTLHPGAGAAVIAPLVGDTSFMLAEEDQHLSGRKAIMPAFHNRTIAAHRDMVEQVTQRHIAQWPRERPFPAHPLLRALSLEVILQTLFGSGVSTTDLHSELLAMLTITASLTLQEPPLRRLPGWHATWRRFLAHRTVVRQLLSRIVAEIADDPTDLLAGLLHTRNPDGSAMTPQQVHDNLMSLILAGHETTASELAWALQLLAHNPLVCETLTSELNRGDTSYLTATVCEVLRHRPVFLFSIPRAVRKPLHIAGATYEPPIHLLGCVHLLHHDPTIYPNPDLFAPERFLRKPPQSRYWLPWGGGRKRCPGKHLATLEMHTVLSTIVADMSITPARRRMERARWRSVIVTPGDGCRIILTRRRTSH